MRLTEGRLTEDAEVLISDNAWVLGGAKTDGSTMFLSPRTRVSVIDLMHGVIIQSGNDAAIALSEHVAGGELAFTDLMNQQAELLGMTKHSVYERNRASCRGHVHLGTRFIKNCSRDYS